MLTLDTKERLGANGSEEFENHPIFAGVDCATYQRQDSVSTSRTMVKSSAKGSGYTGSNYKPTPDNRTRLENVNVTNFTYQGQKDALARQNSGLNSQGKW